MQRLDRRAFRERTRRGPGEVLEVTNQMGLIVIARIDGDSRPVPFQCRQAHCALEADDPGKLLWADSNGRGERSTEVTTRHSEICSEASNMHRRRTLLDPSNGCLDEVRRWLVVQSHCASRESSLQQLHDRCDPAGGQQCVMKTQRL